MGRNEIRLRRKMMSAGNIARHRNYGALMERHERSQKIKRMARFFIYFLLIAFLVIIFIIVLRWEKRQNIKEKTNPDSSVSNPFPPDKPSHTIQFPEGTHRA